MPPLPPPPPSSPEQTPTLPPDGIDRMTASMSMDSAYPIPLPPPPAPSTGDSGLSSSQQPIPSVQTVESQSAWRNIGSTQLAASLGVF